MMESFRDISGCDGTFSPFKDKFRSILTERFNNKKDWWDAVDAEVKKDELFASKVSCALIFAL